MPTHSCLVLYSFCANFLYSLIIWLIQLCHCRAYICYFVVTYLFSLWYDWFLWRCFVLLLAEIIIISLFVSFSLQFYFVIFFWSACDSKSHQIYTTLLFILANLRNAWYEFQFLQSLLQDFSDCSCPPTTNGITVNFTFNNFSVLSEDPSICRLIRFLLLFSTRTA